MHEERIAIQKEGNIIVMSGYCEALKKKNGRSTGCHIKLSRKGRDAVNFCE